MKIDLRNVPDAEVSGIDLANVDITVPAPETEPQRQYYFMALLKQQLVPERAKQNGKEYLTACITTFGCQMNARDSENWRNSGNRRLPHCGDRRCRFCCLQHLYRP